MEKDKVFDADTCPKCARDRGVHHNMVFMVSPCGHKVCDDCRQRMYGYNQSAQCHQCRMVVNKNAWTEQRFEDIGVQKEVQIRAKYQKEWNKTREDFKTLDEYNDYLEEFEEIIYCLVNNENVEWAKEKLQRNMQENHRLIQKNQERQDKEDQRLELELQAQKRAQQARWQESLAKMDKERQDKIRERNDIIDQLAEGTKPADEIIRAAEEQKLMKAKATAQKQVLDRAEALGPVRIAVPADELIPYTYRPPAPMDIDGPVAPALGEVVPDHPMMYEDQVIVKTKRDNIHATVGGFQYAYAYVKNLQDAYCCLHVPARSIAQQ
eukprot:comp21815_c0_seq1/m.31079 comp21815_c0_seq1/g.31079  ORF comp21815_c0_seq1/g.31079 comp21815_c0_seq1/m.31079 type:complete len:323 (-) comp21815_c0_seq1:512-1480(-)